MPLEIVSGSITERVNRLLLGSGLQITQDADGIATLDLNPITAVTVGYADAHYLALSGGTLTGGLAGTTGYFAGAVNVAGALTQAGNQVLHAGNYNSYAPTLTGTGASGTWGISISGSAPWSGITDKPTTIAGYGITDFTTRFQAESLLDAQLPATAHFATRLGVGGAADGSYALRVYSDAKFDGNLYYSNAQNVYVAGVGRILSWGSTDRVYLGDIDAGFAVGVAIRVAGVNRITMDNGGTNTLAGAWGISTRLGVGGAADASYTLTVYGKSYHTGPLYAYHTTASDNSAVFSNTSATGYGAYFSGGVGSQYAMRVDDYAGNPLLTVTPSGGTIVYGGLGITGVLNLPTNTWHLSSDGNQRIYFAGSGRTYIKGIDDGTAAVEILGGTNVTIARFYSAGGGTLYGAWTVNGANNAYLSINKQTGYSEASVLYQSNGSNVWQAGLRGGGSDFGFYSYTISAEVLHLNAAGGGTLYGAWYTAGSGNAIGWTDRTTSMQWVWYATGEYARLNNGTYGDILKAYKTGEVWEMHSAASYVQIAFYRGTSTVAGYIIGDSSGFGLYDSAGATRILMTTGGGTFYGRWDIRGGGSTSATYGLVVTDSANSRNNFYVRDDGFTFIYAALSLNSNLIFTNGKWIGLSSSARFLTWDTSDYLYLGDIDNALSLGVRIRSGGTNRITLPAAGGGSFDGTTAWLFNGALPQVSVSGATTRTLRPIIYSGSAPTSGDTAPDGTLWVKT